MSNILAVMVATVTLLALRVDAAPAQKTDAEAPEKITRTGCVSAKPDATGRFTFEDKDGLTRYQLKGRRLSRFAGRRVELVGGTTGAGLSIRGGLVGPQAGPRGVALDPAQESIRRQPGGGGTGIGPTYPEFRVSRVKVVDGVCETADRR